MAEKTRAQLTRRALLIAGGSAVVLAGAAGFAVDENILPGRSTMFKVLGLDGSPGVIPKNVPGPMVNGSFVSKRRLDKTCGWAISYPPGSAPGDAMPVVITLHGFGGSHEGGFSKNFALQRFQAQAVARGSNRFAIASVDGGKSYWHKRITGDDAGAMVIDEFIPLLASRGLNTSRVGLLGWSMGGFGALFLASQLGAERCAVVVAESPAMWFRADQAARGAFDSPADFAAHTPLGKQKELDGIDVRVDCGIGDGFYPVAEKYVAGFSRPPAGGFVAGGHTAGYWRGRAPDQLAFVASSLS
jgi:pimeloyl-ACP methyl ester carboxylesterase